MCSPDLTPLDFFLWRYIKTKVNDTEKIEQRMKNETLENVFDDIVKRFKVCIDVNGDTFEQKLLEL